jgi:hypothetical protein
LPISGLAIGAMSPDFEYLFRLAVYSRIGHTTWGLTLFAIPLAFVVWLVFSRLVRPALVDLLPPGLARAMRPPVLSLALGLAAVAVGAVSHVMWDGVTHRRAWTSSVLPFLLTTVPPGLPLYRLLQHLSGVFGLVVIAVWARRWVQSQPASARRFAPGQARWSVRVSATLVAIACVAGLTNAAFRQPVRNVGDWLALFIVGGMAAFALSALAFALTRRLQSAGKNAEGVAQNRATIPACPD